MSVKRLLVLGLLLTAIAAADEVAVKTGAPVSGNAVQWNAGGGLVDAGGIAAIGFPTSGISVTSGGGTSPTISASGSTLLFAVTMGATGSPGTLVLALPAVANDWNCTAIDRTPSTPLFGSQQGASSTNSATIKWLNGTPSNNDVVSIQCQWR